MVRCARRSRPLGTYQTPRDLPNPNIDPKLNPALTIIPTITPTKIHG